MTEREAMLLSYVLAGIIVLVVLCGAVALVGGW